MFSTLTQGTFPYEESSRWARQLYDYDLYLWRTAHRAFTRDSHARIEGLNVSPFLVSAIADTPESALGMIASGSHLSFVSRQTNTLLERLERASFAGSESHEHPLSTPRFASTYWVLFARMAERCAEHAAETFGTPVAVAEYLRGLSHVELLGLADARSFPLATRENERALAARLREASLIDDAPIVQRNLARLVQNAHAVSRQARLEWEA